MKYRRSRFTPEFKLRTLAALDARNGDVAAVAQEFDVSPKTLRDWRRQRQFILEQTEEYQRSQEMQRSISIRIEMLMNYILDSLPSKVDSAKLGDAYRTFTALRNLKQEWEPDVPPQQPRVSPFREKLANMIAYYQAEAEAAEAERRAAPNLDHDFDEYDAPPTA